MRQITPLQQFGALASLIFITFIWGSTFMLVQRSVAELEVYYFLFLRFAIAAAAMALIFRSKIKPPTGSTIRSAFILSIFLFGGYAFQTEGLRFTTSSNCALISGLYLIFIPLFSIALFKVRPRTIHVVGACVSLAGLYFLTRYSPTGFNLGDGLTLISAISFAFQIILVGQYTKSHNLAPLVFFEFLFVSLISLAIALTRMKFTIDFSMTVIITLLVTGLIATAFAFAVQAKVQRYIEPTRVGIVFALESVFGLIFGVFVGNETLTMLSFAGACSMICGMMIAEAKPVVKYLMDKITG